MKLAFVETAAQARGVPDGHRIVALEPHAQVALEQAGRPFARPEDYVEDGAVQEAGLANFSIVEDLCAAIDAILAARLPQVAEHRLLPARWDLMALKPLYDGLSLRAHLLLTILDRERPHEVAWFPRPPAGSLYGSLLAVLVPAAGAATRLLPPCDPPPPAARSGLGLRSRTRGALGRLARSGRRGDGLHVLFLDSLYGLPAIAAELRRIGHTVTFWPAGRMSDVRVDMSRVWSGVEADARVRQAFVRDGLDLWPAAAPRLRGLLDQGVPYVLGQHAAAVRILASARPEAILTSVAAFPREKAICHAARSAGVPTIVSRHGELGSRHVPMVAHQDVESVDWALCWGRWEADWTARHAPRPVGTVVVGAPMIEEAVARAPARERIRALLGVEGDARVALYVPTGLSGEEWYASRRAPTDSAYFRQETAIVRTLARLEGTRVVVKEHPFGRPTPLEAWCAPLAVVDLLYEPEFSQLIHLADLVVLDAPSTTLVQALFGSAPIYVIDHPVFEWEPGVREHLTRHGVVFCTVAELGARVRDDDVAGRASGYPAEAREPLLAGGPGNAAARAATAIVEIASAGR